MLAENCTEADIRFPCFGSFKIDGVRVLGRDGLPGSRNGKVHRNLHLQKLFAEHARVLQGLDGEIIVGDPFAPDVCRRSSSACSTIEGVPDFQLHLFDRWDTPTEPYHQRLRVVRDRHDYELPSWCHVVRQFRLHNHAELMALEAEALALGYEGLILRDPDAPYKNGRSTLKQGWLLKFKRFQDFEATVVGVEERMHNGNEAETSELGYTTRSSHQENLIGMGTLGALWCEGLTAFQGKRFKVGTFKGFTAEELKELWDGGTLVGRIAKLEHFPIGVKDLPRFPKLLDWRSIEDVG
jgi:DNA ligase-1